MKIGDKVETISDSLKGTITGIIDEETVVIVDENGFDWEVSKSDLRLQEKDLRMVELYSQGNVVKDERSDRHVSKSQSDSLEVDLHAEALLGNTKWMEPAFIKDQQLRKVKEILNQHKRQKGFKIVFIHGIGEGILKHDIETFVRKNYPSCQIQDANYGKYGMDGATQVTIH